MKICVFSSFCEPDDDRRLAVDFLRKLNTISGDSPLFELIEIPEDDYLMMARSLLPGFSDPFAEEADFCLFLFHRNVWGNIGQTVFQAARRAEKDPGARSLAAFYQNDGPDLPGIAALKSRLGESGTAFCEWRAPEDLRLAILLMIGDLGPRPISSGLKIRGTDAEFRGEKIIGLAKLSCIKEDPDFLEARKELDSKQATYEYNKIWQGVPEDHPSMVLQREEIVRCEKEFLRAAGKIIRRKIRETAAALRPGHDASGEWYA